MRPVRVVPATIALTLLAPLLAVLFGGPALSASAGASATPTSVSVTSATAAASVPTAGKKGKKSKAVVGAEVEVDEEIARAGSEAVEEKLGEHAQEELEIVTEETAQAEEEEEVQFFGFSTDDDDSSDEEMDGEPEGLDVAKLPTIAKDDAIVKRKLEKAKRKPVRALSWRKLLSC